MESRFDRGLLISWIPKLKKKTGVRTKIVKFWKFTAK